MHKSATKCNETLSKWCKNKHGASKIIDTLETYQLPFSNIGLHFPLQIFYIKIEGLVMKNAITCAECYGYDVFDVTIHRLQQLDQGMYPTNIIFVHCWKLANIFLSY
jgi:hypothetical protein